jgi:O-antigen biosynthesis protein
MDHRASAGILFERPPVCTALMAGARAMSTGTVISTNGNGRTSIWRRYAGRVTGLTRFALFSGDAALDRLKRTGPRAFVRDLPMLLRLGLNYFRAMRPGLGLVPEQMPPYDAWMAVNRWTPGAEQLLKDRLAACSTGLPKISILMPVRDPPVQLLDAAIASVAAQVYQDWELCIADDQSADPEVRQSLSRWAKRDGRIKVRFMDVHGHICRTTNAAAELATGEFFLFLDHDDLLTPDALAEVGLYVADHAQTDFVYSDNDKIDVRDRRYDPEFKPDYSPELLLSYMYFTHLCAVRRSVFSAVGGTRAGFEGSQDHDLALRACERARHVGHIPLVLYHWRSVAGSAAANGNAKSYSFAAGINAVQEACDRRGLSAAVFQPQWARQGALGIYSVEFPDDGPSVAILIPTRNRLATLKKCVDSLRRTSYRNYQVIVIDNDSDDPATLRYLAASPHRVLRVSTNGVFNYSALNNAAARATDAEYLLLLNNDTEVLEPKWLSRMVGHAHAQGVGAVGARLVYPDRHIQHAGVVHGIHHGMAGHAFKYLPPWENGYLCHARLTRNYSAVTAACLLTPRKLFLEMGGLDQEEFGVAYNDVDYCYKLVDRGYRCVYVAGAELIHHEGHSRGFNDHPSEIAAFRRRYLGRVDPYYSPHLSLDDEQFRVIPRRVAPAAMRPIRLCAFSRSLDLTGAPLCQYEIASALTEQGVIEPMVATLAEGPLRQWYEQRGVNVQVLGERNLLTTLSRPDTYERFVTELGQTMKHDWKVDLVYANSVATVFAVDAAARAGIPVVWQIHESDGWQNHFAHVVGQNARKCLDCFTKPYRVVFGCISTRQIYDALNSAHNFCTIRNPIDLRRLASAAANWTRSSARQSLGLSDDELVLLNVGTICPRKGQKDLVDVLPRLPENLRQRVRCILLGDQSSVYAHQMAQSMGDGASARVVLAPLTEDVARYYRAADVFVSCSRTESYPRVTQEAMFMGLPLIVAPVFGIAEQISNGACGRYYTPGNLEELADAIEELADETVRRRMGQLSPLVLESQGTFAAVVCQFGQIFREAYLSGI